MFLAYDPASNPLNTNDWAFPLCECVHIASFALSLGTIGIVDLRMLGLGIVDRPPAQLLRDTQIWTLLGLILVITSGLAIFTSDPVSYVHNLSFRLKMYGLVAAILFNYTIHRGAASRNSSGGTGAAVAICSLALWWSLVLTGVFIGFI